MLTELNVLTTLVNLALAICVHVEDITYKMLRHDANSKLISVTQPLAWYIYGDPKMDVTRNYSIFRNNASVLLLLHMELRCTQVIHLATVNFNIHKALLFHHNSLINNLNDYWGRRKHVLWIVWSLTICIY